VTPPLGRPALRSRYAPDAPPRKRRELGFPLLRDAGRGKPDRVDDLTYPEHGATRAALPSGYYHLERRARLGTGRAVFERSAAALMSWQMHRAAGLRVTAEGDARPGERVVSRIAPAIAAPCRVVYVIDEPGRRGFAYGTLRNLLRLSMKALDRSRSRAASEFSGGKATSEWRATGPPCNMLSAASSPPWLKQAAGIADYPRPARPNLDAGHHLHGERDVGLRTAYSRRLFAIAWARPRSACSNAGAIASISACRRPYEAAVARQCPTALVTCASTSAASWVFRRK